MKYQYFPFWKEAMTSEEEDLTIEKLFDLLTLENGENIGLKYIFVPNPPSLDLAQHFEAFDEIHFFSWGKNGKGIWTDSGHNEKKIAKVMFHLRSEMLFVFSLRSETLTEMNIQNWIEAFFNNEFESSESCKCLVFDWGDLRLN